jgi:hypothetical protein
MYFNCVAWLGTPWPLSGRVWLVFEVRGCPKIEMGAETGHTKILIGRIFISALPCLRTRLMVGVINRGSRWDIEVGYENRVSQSHSLAFGKKVVTDITNWNFVNWKAAPPPANPPIVKLVHLGLRPRG